MTDRTYEQGWKAGVQAAWEVVNSMVGELPAAPRTNNVRMMREAGLDIADAILDLKNGADAGTKRSAP